MQVTENCLIKPASKSFAAHRSISPHTGNQNRLVAGFWMTFRVWCDAIRQDALGIAFCASRGPQGIVSKLAT